jgi:superfamily II DNA or RNA helicase
MKACTLELRDELNCRFTGLDPETRRKLVNELKYFLPYARHTPAFKLGRWDGTIAFCDIGGRTYINLLDRVLPIVADAGYEVELDDRREQHNFTFELVKEDSYSHLMWPHGHPLAGKPIVLRDYQVELINDYLVSPQCVNICPTAGGKTIVTAVLSHKVEKYGRSIVIVPTKDLVTQTEEDYINMGLDVGVYFGDRKEFNKTHTICTWQSLEVLKKMKDGSIEEFVEGVICVIVDEVHKAKADVLRALLSGPFGHTPLRWGLTGTLPEEEHEQISVLACIGPTSGVIKATDLQDAGYLSNCHINVWQLKDPGGFDNYQSELKWLTTSRDRIKYIGSILTDLAAEGNTLVLVDRVQTGEMLEEQLGCVFISGKVKSTDRKDEYKSVQFEDNKLIIATYGVASTGININRIFNLVLLEPGKSFVRVIQSIGRGLRIAEDKDFVNVYDLTSTSKYAKRHLTKRKRFYKDAGYPFTIKKIDYL